MNWIPPIEIAGTFAFAVSGAFAGMRKELDPFGVLIMAFVPAIGGGTLRDILINDLPVAWLRNSMTIWVIVVAAVLADEGVASAICSHPGSAQWYPNGMPSIGTTSGRLSNADNATGHQVGNLLPVCSLEALSLGTAAS